VTLRAFITDHGGPEVIRFEPVDPPPPARGEVRMRQTAIGLNYLDTTQRRGFYPVPLPTGLGVEAAGVIEAVGEEVRGFKAGDRVCTFGPTPGAYAHVRNVPAAALFHTPASLGDELVAAALLKACTAEFLVERCACVQPGQTVLVHAAAGGVGLLLVQWLRHVGARVIGTVGSTAKADLALAAGCHEVILYRQEDTARRVRQMTDGEGVRITFDGVGADTWEASLDSTGRRGMIVNYGNAGPALANLRPGILATKGSLYNTRPMLWHYYETPEERAAGSARVFSLLENGTLGVRIGQRYPLLDARRAHEDLEARRTTGSGLLLP
jgi:NADPH:quinone reductase